jgi:hypothetical protein
MTQEAVEVKFPVDFKIAQTGDRVILRATRINNGDIDTARTSYGIYTVKRGDKRVLDIGRENFGGMFYRSDGKPARSHPEGVSFRLVAPTEEIIQAIEKQNETVIKTQEEEMRAHYQQQMEEERIVSVIKEKLKGMSPDEIITYLSKGMIIQMYTSNEAIRNVVDMGTAGPVDQ